MQIQGNELSPWQSTALPMPPMGCGATSLVRSGRDGQPPMPHRSESWSIHHWRARELSLAVRRRFAPPHQLRTAEKFDFDYVNI